MPGVIVRQSMRDYASWAKRLGSGFGQAIQRGTVSGAARCIAVMQRRTREAIAANPRGIGDGGAVNTGSYLRSWRSTALVPIGAALFNSALHAAIVELGRRPGARMPPLDAIARWAQRRLGLSYAEARARAFLNARAIQRRGLLPRLVMTNGLDEMVRVVEEEQQRELDAALEQRIG